MKVSDAKVIDLPKFLDKRGNLSFAEEFRQVSLKGSNGDFRKLLIDNFHEAVCENR